MAYFRCGQGGGTSLIIQITTSATVLYGQTITISKNGTTVGTTTFDNTGEAEYTVDESGTYTVSVTFGGTTFTDTVEVTDTFDVQIEATPDGSTVTPVNDIQIWLHCGNVWDKNYTTLSEVLADTTTLLALISSQNAVDYMVRSHDWCTDVCADATAMTYIGANNYAADTLLADDNPGLVPVMTSATTPSGEASADMPSGVTTYSAPYLAFDGNDSTRAHFYASSAFTGKLIYHFPNPVVVKEVYIKPYVDTNGAYLPSTGTLLGSTDGINYTSIGTINSASSGSYSVIADNDTAYSYYAVQFASVKYGSADYLSFIEVQFYAKDGSWLESICSSTYFESVLNVKVPTMTSNTTPSGVASAYHPLNATFDALDWRAFDGVYTSGNYAQIGYATNSDVGRFQYQFTENVKIYRVDTSAGAGSYTGTAGLTGEVQYSTDGTTWSDLGSIAHSESLTTKVLTNTAAAAHWGIYFNHGKWLASSYNVYTVDMSYIQFYGRAAV